MNTPKYFIDIHCHPSMKSYYSSLQHSKKNNLWDFQPESCSCKKLPKFFKSQLKEMIKHSQMNLRDCEKGRVKILFSSLYSVERGWFKERRAIDPLISDIHFANSIACSSGFHEKIVDRIIKTIDNNLPIDYFAEIAGEYFYLNSDIAKSTNPDERFIIANCYNDLIDIEENTDSKTLALIVNIEGGHCLFRFDDFDDLKNTAFRKVDHDHFLDFKKYRKIVFQNIDVLKGLKETEIKVDGSTEKIVFKHCPFYITVAHHFWNLLCGHSDSFGIGGDLMLNQSRGKNRKFTQLGREILNKLLERGEGKRRILIDIKHMSVKARQEFYAIWQTDYYGQSDNFPIISSHTAINGRNSYKYVNNDYEENSFFNTADINMFDEDIQMIHKSGGIMGIILNEARLPGHDSKMIVKQNKKRIANLLKMHPQSPEIKELRNENKQEYLKSLVANIFYTIHVLNKKSAWDILSIGSDFDGMIDALDNYVMASDFPLLSSDLKKFIDNCKGIPEIGINEFEFNKLKFNYSSDEIIEKLFHSNAILFLKKYFHDDFLMRGIVH
jgi:microsomal dipeptidase-like Zn-dependent dipeptidase